MRRQRARGAPLPHPPLISRSWSPLYNCSNLSANWLSIQTKASLANFSIISHSAVALATMVPTMHTQLSTSPQHTTHPDIITSALAKECSAGRTAGPYSQQPVPNLCCSGLDIAPKQDEGWRVIHHLSAPHGSSINDHIDPSCFSLRYCSIDTAVSITNRLGPGTLTGKLDLKNAFRLIPVRREGWHLLGTHWQGQWYLDKCLRFGLRSSPALFNQLAEALEWILHNNYAVTHIIHYLDYFFIAGPPGSDVCQNSMDAMAQVCATLNIPIKLEKTEGPATSLTFLGISLDSVVMKASITLERKVELASAITALQGKHTCTKHQLLSLVGKLAFAYKVVPPGRTSSDA